MTNFSFDEWANLYEANPAEFERKRKELLEAEIMKAPPEHRPMLRVLQMECDAIRAVSSPMEATVEFSKMAAKKLKELKTPLTQLRQICEDIIEP